MFVPSTGITVTLHKVLTLHIIFAQAVDNNMYMDIAVSVMPVRVGADKSLMSGEILFAVCKPKQLCLFPGQPTFVLVFWVEADDVVVGLDFVIILIFMETGIQFPAFYIETERIALYTVKIIFFPELHFSIFIKDRFSGVLIMLENEISLCFTIVRIFTCNVFQFCHENPLPS